jgi:hypothetical protein
VVLNVDVDLHVTNSRPNSRVHRQVAFELRLK